MRRNGIYSTNIKRSKPVSKILAAVFGALFVVLLTFIIWSALAFNTSEQGGYVPQAQEISTLKITVEEQNKLIEELRAENATLKEELETEKKKMEELLKPEEPPEEEDSTEPEDE